MCIYIDFINVSALVNLKDILEHPTLRPCLEPKTSLIGEHCGRVETFAPTRGGSLVIH